MNTLCAVISKKVVVAYANIFLVRNNNQSHIINTCNIITLMITIFFEILVHIKYIIINVYLTKNVIAVS